jgi:hypothetical protein
MTAIGIAATTLIIGKIAAGLVTVWIFLYSKQLNAMEGTGMVLGIEGVPVHRVVKTYAFLTAALDLGEWLTSFSGRSTPAK